jgi:hypothetical protein
VVSTAATVKVTTASRSEPRLLKVGTLVHAVFYDA